LKLLSIFSVEAREKSPGQKSKKKYARCTFHHIATSHVRSNFMKFGVRGQFTDVIMRQIFSQSVQGLQSSDTPKLAFPIDLLCCPYNSVRTAVRHCEMTCLKGL